jgi:serine protease Do
MKLLPKSPAEKAELKPNDVVLTYDGVEVQDESHLINMVSLTPVGKKVKLVIYRGGKHITLEMTVVDRQDFDNQNLRSEGPSRPDMGTYFESLGLRLHQLDPEVAPQLGFDESAKGLLVLKVDRNGPMDGKIHLYDLIEEVARTPVATFEDLRTALDHSAANDMVLLTVKRRAEGKLESQVVTYRRP